MTDYALSKIWGSWEPNMDGTSGTLMIGQKELTRIEFSEITFEEYLAFINDLQKDLGQVRTLLDRMNVLRNGGT